MGSHAEQIKSYNAMSVVKSVSTLKKGAMCGWGQLEIILCDVM